jgi:UDP-N-acetylmuramyl pentapeptide phosphotransferase/UDP-N-acetylglucosamine-1-phosphate transferase
MFEPQSLLLWLPMLAFCISCACTAWLIKDLANKGQVDHPIERSLHQAPTPRGGGLAIMGAFIPCAAFLGLDLMLLSMLVVLIVVSWLDDQHPLDWRLRLLAQSFAVGFSLASLWQMGLITSLYDRMFFSLPLVLFVAALGLGWMWHINLTNFLDGIDGYAAMQSMIIAFGTGIYFLAFLNYPLQALLAFTLGAATLGFFVWNYPPARIFLGEVGSVPLGFLTGYLLLVLSEKGGWGLAFALPLWFWLDATYTLFRRIYEKKSPVQAHKEHFYQRAAGQTPHGHKRVLKFYILLQVFNCLVIALLIRVLPLHQWVLPFVSLAFGVIYFYGLAKFIKQQPESLP